MAGEAGRKRLCHGACLSRHQRSEVVENKLREGIFVALPYRQTVHKKGKATAISHWCTPLFERIFENGERRRIQLLLPQCQGPVPRYKCTEESW